jgi:hypothetical protein
MPPKKPPTPAKETTTTSPDIRIVNVPLPVQEVDASTVCPRNIDVKLNHEQAKMFRGLFDGLQEEGVRFKGGTPGSPPGALHPIRSYGDVIRYLTEQLL